MHDVFISYSTHDKPIADAVCAGLEQKGIRCWIAPRDILAGVEWGQAIVEAISSAKVMVLLLSDHANQSSQIPKEVDRAVNKGVAIIPLRIQDVQPKGALEYYLGPAHWLDAINPPMQGNIDRLATNINALLMRGSGPGTASGASTIGITSQPHVGPGVTRDPSTPKPVSVPPIRSSQSAAPAIPRSPPPRVPPTNFPPSVGVEQPLADNVRIVLYLASGFVPILGFVLFFLYKDKPAASDRKAAQICLIVGICSFVLSVLFGCLCVLAGSAAEGY